METFDIFNTFTQNIGCWHTLEVPRRGGSRVYPQSIFGSEIRGCSNVYPQSML